MVSYALFHQNVVIFALPYACYATGKNA